MDPIPRCSIYGIFTYIYHNNSPNVDKYIIHWIGYGLAILWICLHAPSPQPWKLAKVQKQTPWDSQRVPPLCQLPGDFSKPPVTKTRSQKIIEHIYRTYIYIYLHLFRYIYIYTTMCFARWAMKKGPLGCFWIYRGLYYLVIWGLNKTIRRIPINQPVSHWNISRAFCSWLSWWFSNFLPSWHLKIPVWNPPWSLYTPEY